MTFKTRCKKFQNKTSIDIKSSTTLTSYEICHSFNSDTNIDDNTKIVIVGTLTPKKGRQNGYFYSSPSNRMFEILDTYFKSKNIDSNLGSIKKRLLENPNNQDIINQLKKELTKLHIALLDVVDTAIASTTNASDDEIIDFNLDYTTFQKYSNMEIVYICNSRNAEYALNIISEHNHQKMKIDFAPQIWRKSKKAIQDRWNTVLEKAFK